MLKIIVLLYFLIVTVTGQMQLQNNGQDQSNRIQLQSPAEQALVFKDATPRIARRKPCQKRRRLETPDGKPPSAGWIPSFHHIKSVHPIDQKILRDVNNEQLRPQSLKESKDIIQEDQVKLSDNPTQIPVTNNPAIKTEEYFIPDENYAKAIKEIEANPNKLRISNNEDPIDEYLCQPLEEAEDSIARADKPKTSKQNNKPASDEVNKQAMKLISKCVQDAKSAAGLETTSRRSSSGNSAPLSEKSGSSTLNVPVNDDNDGANRNDALQTNNDFDASQPIMLRSKPAVVQAPSGQEERKAHFEIVTELQYPVMRATNTATNISDSKVSLLKNGRVCYACSSANDVSCSQPGRNTTIKYCKKQDDACIIKTVETHNDLITIRDCGNTCNENNLPGVSPKYKSCRICHEDMCNSAVTIDSFNMLLLTFLMAAFKYTL